MPSVTVCAIAASATSTTANATHSASLQPCGRLGRANRTSSSGATITSPVKSPSHQTCQVDHADESPIEFESSRALVAIVADTIVESIPASNSRAKTSRTRSSAGRKRARRSSQ
jgi:hypothetical protein